MSSRICLANFSFSDPPALSGLIYISLDSRPNAKGKFESRTHIGRLVFLSLSLVVVVVWKWRFKWPTDSHSGLTNKSVGPKNNSEMKANFFLSPNSLGEINVCADTQAGVNPCDIREFVLNPTGQLSFVSVQFGSVWFGSV